MIMATTVSTCVASMLSAFMLERVCLAWSTAFIVIFVERLTLVPTCCAEAAISSIAAATIRMF